MTHEDFSRPDDIKPSSDRSFGLFFAAFFLIVALWPLIRTEPVRWWALAVGAIFTVLALLWTPALAPFNKLWLKLGLLLYTIVNPVVLGLLPSRPVSLRSSRNRRRPSERILSQSPSPHRSPPKYTRTSWESTRI